MKPLRLGMLTPSSNTVVEPYTDALLAPLFPDVTAHYSRFRVTRIALDAGSDAQFSLEPILAAADLLADARVDVIAWNGTSAAWLGLDRDRTLCQAIRARCGITATSAMLGLGRLLARDGIDRIGLVTPYTGDVQEKIIANFAAAGIAVAGESHAALSDNFSFSTLSEEEIAEACRAVAASRPGAIVILCTNMRGPLVAARLEQELGIPVYDSVAFTLWACLGAAGMDTAALAGFGACFAGGIGR